MDENVKNKDKSILNVYNLITNKTGLNYFEEIDFWEGDFYAIGLKKENKLVYISSYAFRNLEEDKMRYYSEFEIININSLETEEKIKLFDKISGNELLHEIILFLNL